MLKYRYHKSGMDLDENSCQNLDVLPRWIPQHVQLIEYQNLMSLLMYFLGKSMLCSCCLPTMSSIRYIDMEGYQGHNSNTHYALFNLPVTDVYYALSQSACQLYAFCILQNDRSDNSIRVFCTPNPPLCFNTKYLSVIWILRSMKRVVAIIPFGYFYKNITESAVL